MYLGVVKLGANLTFYSNTHTPSTGAAVDADEVPGYRVYEDETATPLLTGSMALLDGDNTTGFYSEQIAVTSGNGFEAGKNYCIRITGVVATVTGVELHTFSVQARAQDDLAYPATTGRSLDVDVDGKVLLQPTQAGVTIPTVTTLTNDPSGVTTLLSRLSATRAGYLDNLSAGAAALEASVQTLLTRLSATRAGYLDNLSAGAVATAAKLLSFIQSLARSDATEDADIAGTFDSATDSLQAIRDRGDSAWVTKGSDAGTLTLTYTLTRSDTGAAIDAATVELYSDEAMSALVASGTTNSLGVVTFSNLVAGTYYLKRIKNGYSFDNPDTEVVAA